MSLRVWLPLNGTLDNQGLDQVTVINNGATVDNNGKIGKCYSFDGNTSGININGNIIPTLAQGDFSICFWIYNDDQGNRSIYIATIPSSSFAFAIQKTTGEGLRVYWQSSPDYYPTNFTVPVQEWCHITVVIKNNNCYCYRNGILITSREDGSFTPQKLTNTWLYGMLGRDLRTGATVLKGKMNDFRWYDHALSPFEVKQISQGLVLHYPLNRGGFGQGNFILESHKVISGGQGSGITRTYESDGSVKIVSTSGNGNYASLGFAKNSNDSVGNNMVVGDIYCISCDTKIESGTKLPTLFINSGNGYKQLKPINDSIVIGKWIRVYYTSTWANPGTNYGNISLHLGFGDAIGTYYFKNFKLEKGSIPTPWCPNSADELYSTLGLNDNIQYDTSGYGNNGTKVGTFSYDSDTPKYNVSTNFNGTDNCIQLENISSLLQDVFTINLWFKKDSLGSKGFETLFGGPSGFEMDTRSGSSQTLSLYMALTRGGNVYSPFNFGEWYMITLVNDGTNELYYVNGELVKTITKKSMPSGNYFIGAWQTNAKQNYKGLISDFRVYTTALSAQNILSLYNNSAYIDNQGNIYGAVYEEV